jgi:hypothetical protein
MMIYSNTVPYLLSVRHETGPPVSFGVSYGIFSPLCCSIQTVKTNLNPQFSCNVQTYLAVSKLLML